MEEKEKFIIYLTFGKREDILSLFSNLNIGSNDYNLYDGKYVPSFFIRFIKLKNEIGQYFIRFNRFLQKIFYRKKYLSLRGVGTPFGIDEYEVYKYILKLVIDNTNWELLKFIIKKLHTLSNSKSYGNKYINIVNYVYEPFDVKVSILIPNNINNNTLQRVLDSAESIYKSIIAIRIYLNYKEIIIKYDTKSGMWNFGFHRK